MLYVARDEDGELNLFKGKPKKGLSWWVPVVGYRIMELDRDLFPEVWWEDEEPTQVELKIK